MRNFSRLSVAILLMGLVIAFGCDDDDNPSTPAQDPPFVSTGSLLTLGEQSASVAGRVDTMGAETDYWFEYGPDLDYGTSTAEMTLAPDPAGSRSVEGSFVGLMPATVYHYRLVARNSGGTTAGDDASFMTLIPNRTPETHLTSAPSDTMAGEVRWHAYWTGSDVDGEVMGFELRAANHGPDHILDPADSLGVPWTMTTVTDSILTWPDGLGARTLFVRAVDDENARDPTPAQIAINPALAAER